MNNPLLNAYYDQISQAVFGHRRPDLNLTGTAKLPSKFAVTDFACACIGAAATALADLSGTPASDVTVDRRLASMWFDRTRRPLGWNLPDVWDPLAGNYRTKDGWIRLHTNAPHHRDAALRVLGCPPTREAITRTVRGCSSSNLETTIVEAGGCAAELRTMEAWAAHPQGQAVQSEPLIHWTRHSTAPRKHTFPEVRPLAGVRVLDLTRVLAGPVASRFLAQFGADVLRNDPPGWDEPGVVTETTPGKRRAYLDLKSAVGKKTFEPLLREADILLHGYRPGALDGLGFGRESRRSINPALIDISLNAYGHTGPWRRRRGFDSLVQMSSGIASPKGTVDQKPTPLPVQALDHGTGYLMAAAALHALKIRSSGEIRSARLSLARTGHLLASVPNAENQAPLQAGDDDYSTEIENTDWGPAHRMSEPFTIGARTKPAFAYPAGRLGKDDAAWR
ncbi:CoA transferase [Amaricoccus tamworthensis]|uniref:CoA transferase n=1 Tax=Amaricoccus tamworthensis TaxID=57002 RepID=UPI003C7E00F7